MCTAGGSKCAAVGKSARIHTHVASHYRAWKLARWLVMCLCQGCVVARWDPCKSLWWHCQNCRFCDFVAFANHLGKQIMALTILPKCHSTLLDVTDHNGTAKHPWKWKLVVAINWSNLDQLHMRCYNKVLNLSLRLRQGIWVFNVSIYCLFVVHVIDVCLAQCCPRLGLNLTANT